jgi:hypothetical protein
MRKQLLALLVAPIVLAAARGPDPVITIEGVSAAAKLSPAARAALAPKVKSLNAMLEKMLPAHKEAAKAAGTQRADHHELMKEHHDLMTELHEVMKQLSPEQRAAVHEYLLAKCKEAGIEIPAEWRQRHGQGVAVGVAA